jgi:chromosome segregation ATPase
MFRLWFLALGFFLASTVALGQTTPTDSQTLQALLSEIRQLRKDLQTTTVASQRVQILTYRLQSQQGAVARVQQRLDGVHAKLAEAQAGVRHFTSEIERAEAALNEPQNSAEADRKQVEGMLATGKRELESQKAAEQEWETKEAEAVQDLRSEQSKLAALEEQLDQLDKILEGAARQSATGPRQ